MSNRVRNRKPTHPGKIFKEEILDQIGISITEASKRLSVTRKALSEVLNEKSALSPEMAIKWGIATNTNPDTWFNIQKKLTLSKH